MFYFFLHSISLLLSAIPLVFVAEICRDKFDGTRTPLWLTLLLQGLFYGFLSEYTWSNFPSAAAIIGIGVAAWIVVLTGLLGLALYPILFLLLIRPGRWKTYLKRFLVGYTIALLALASPRLITMSGLTTNVDVYGRVIDIDGQPVANASVKLGNCGYFRENPVITDHDGIFHVIATCDLLIFESITDPATGADCEPGENNDDYLMAVGEDPDFSRLWEKGFHWKHRLRENPYTFECIWEIPASLREYRAGGRKILVDGRPYHIEVTSERSVKRLRLVEGAAESGLEISLLIDKPATSDQGESGTGQLEVSFVGGAEAGITSKRENPNPYLAPASGYRDKLLIEFDDSGRFHSRFVYFRNSAGTHFGRIRIDVNKKRGLDTRDVFLSIHMDPLGSRVIDADRVQREQIEIDNLSFY